MLNPSPAVRPDWQAVDAVEGWFSFQSFCLWNALLDAQRERGGLMEIGVHKGRSASLLAAHLQAEESLVLCDPALGQGPPAALGSVPADRLVIVAERSSKLRNNPALAGHRQAIRWISIDGEHSARAVYGDLEVADEYLSEGGLVALDDFFSPQYPQVTAAAYQFLERNPFRFSLILIGFLKAYLCRPSHYLFYQDFIVRHLPARMEEAGSRVSLCKTSGPEDSLTFGLYPYRDDLGPRNGSNGDRFPVIGLAQFEPNSRL